MTGKDPPAPHVDEDLLDRLLEAALALPAAERAAYLDVACQGAAELRAAAERVLREAEEGSFLAPGGGLAGALGDDLADALRSEERESLSGRTYGAYRLVRELGRGGMAVVYLAERADGQFEQRAALKLLKRGIDSEEVERRFLQERQILASLNHPNIARLFDGGMSEDGVPYFALEVVDGEPIDRFCDQRRLTVEERIRLFLVVGRAVEYAHRRLVVHRDIKPSNVLVSGEGEVKLLDFGIAKLLDPAADGGLALTRTVMRPMTPEYASPEQVRGEVVTTASDVYQLGLLLYQLLTGRRAHRLGSASSAEIEQAVCESEPTRPSTAAAAASGDPAEAPPPTAVADARGTTPERLRRRLSGDLDRILLTALRKEPERRYPSALALVEDLERHLAGRPVAARGDSALYRAGKFARRHRLGLAAAAAVLVAVVTLVAFYTARLAAERDRAQREAATSARIADFMAKLFEAATPEVAQGEEATASDLLEAGVRRIDDELAAEPELRASLKQVLGRAYWRIGRLDRARDLLEEAVATRVTLFGEDAAATAASRAELARVMILQGDYERARRLAERALAVQRRVLPAGDRELATTLNTLAIAEWRLGRSERASGFFEEALVILERVLGPEDPEVASLLNNLGLTLIKTDPHRAVELFERALAITEGRLGPSHPNIGTSLENLADALRAAGELERVRPVLERALKILETSLGPDHPETGTSLNALANYLQDVGDHAAAQPLYERAIAAYGSSLGPDHPHAAYPWTNLGNLLRDTGEPEAALAHYREALRIREGALAPDHSLVGRSSTDVGAALMRLGRLDEAEPYLVRGLAVRRAALAGDHPGLADSCLALARLHLRRGEAGAAEPLAREALAIRSRSPATKAGELAEAEAVLDECRSAAAETRR